MWCLYVDWELGIGNADMCKSNKMDNYSTCKMLE